MTAPTPDVAFRERRTDRLVIRRFRAEDAATLPTTRGMAPSLAAGSRLYATELVAVGVYQAE